MSNSAPRTPHPGYRPDDHAPLRDCRREREAFRAALDIGTLDALSLDDGRGNRAAHFTYGGRGDSSAVNRAGLGLCADVGGDLVLVSWRDVSSPIVRALLGPRLVVVVAPLYTGSRPPREADVAETEAKRAAARHARYVAEAKAEHAAWQKAYRERCERRHAGETGAAPAPFDRHAEDTDSDGDREPPVPPEHSGA